MNEELYKKPKQLRIISFMILPLVLCLVVVGKLACPCNPQSCAGGSLVLLAGSTMPDWSAGEGSDKKALWSSRLGVGHGASFLTPENKLSYRNANERTTTRDSLSEGGRIFS